MNIDKTIEMIRRNIDDPSNVKGTFKKVLQQILEYSKMEGGEVWFELFPERDSEKADIFRCKQGNRSETANKSVFPIQYRKKKWVN